jgi:Protein of unknown function (DUF3558)
MSSPQPPPHPWSYEPAPGPSGPRPSTLVAIALAVVIVVAGGLTAAILLSGGDDEPAGADPDQAPTQEPSPTSNPAPAEDPTSAADPGPTPIADSTRGIKPCDLLTPTEASGLGFDTGEKDFVDPRACVWEFSDPGNSVRVWIQDDIGLAVVTAAGANAVRLGDHDAIQSLGPTVGPVNSCQVAIGVTDRSRVDVVVNTTAGKQQACRLAMRTARLVEPKLP